MIAELPPELAYGPDQASDHHLEEITHWLSVAPSATELAAGFVRALRILVCGSRDWSRADVVFGELDRWASHHSDAAITIIEGEARGADRMGRRWAEDRGWPVLPFPADWDLPGRAAGPIRNQRMLVEGDPHLVLAFTVDLAASAGTADMVRRAVKAGVEHRVIGMPTP